MQTEIARAQNFVCPSDVELCARARKPRLQHSKKRQTLRASGLDRTRRPNLRGRATSGRRRAGRSAAIWRRHENATLSLFCRAKRGFIFFFRTSRLVLLFPVGSIVLTLCFFCPSSFLRLRFLVFRIFFHDVTTFPLLPLCRLEQLVFD